MRSLDVVKSLKEARESTKKEKLGGIMGSQDNYWLMKFESVEESIYVGKELPFDDDVFRVGGKSRAHWT